MRKLNLYRLEDRIYLLLRHSLLFFTGRQHMRTVQFCACEEEAVTLLQYDLWPSSPKHPRLAFHIELLRWLNGLLLECQISAKGFCEALKARQPKLYKVLVTKEVS